MTLLSIVMANKLIISLSPHIHSGDSVQKNMYGVLIALIPALLVSFFAFGLGALIVTLTSVAACLFFEWAITKYILKREQTTIMDGSAALTGVLLAFFQPACMDYYYRCISRYRRWQDDFWRTGM